MVCHKVLSLVHFSSSFILMIFQTHQINIFYLFADDKNIYFESNHLKHLQSVVNKELNQVRKWLGANKLVINIGETNFVIFHSPHKTLNETVSIKIGKAPVKQAKYVKFLGLFLDENLTWKYHLNELSKN